MVISKGITLYSVFVSAMEVLSCFILKVMEGGYFWGFQIGEK